MIQRLKDVLFAPKIDLYKDEIRRRNYVSYNAFLGVELLISFAVLLFGISMHKVVTFNTEFFLMFAYCAVLFGLSRYCFTKWIKYIVPVFYLTISPIMLMGILMGTFLDPTEPSISIMVFLCVLPLFILDRPWRVVLYITVVGAIYTVCCYIAKDYRIFLADMVDLVTFYFLAIGINCFSLIDRINSVENFEKYRRKSEKDLLTDIFNRGSGVEQVEALIENKVHGAFIVLDIDDFKSVNDNYGHHVGDEVLRAVSEILRSSFRAEDVLLRMGGDEFAVYAVGLTEREWCTNRFEKVFRKVGRIILPEPEKHLSVSLGCVIYNGGDEEFEELYKKGDECLYEAKKAGKSCYFIRT